MASLTGTKIKDTYDGILKTTDNGVLGGTEKLITDGLGNSSGLYLGTSGNVGIGDSNTRSARLLLNNAGSSGAPQLMLIDSGDSGKQAELRFDSGNLIYDYWNGSSRSERMRIDSSGNVGIGGTADSWAKLDVNGQSLLRGNAVLKIGQALKFNNYFNSGTSTNKIVDDGYAGAIYLNAADGSIIFGNSSSSVIGGADVSVTERVRITSGGDVLIGDSTSAGGGKLMVDVEAISGTLISFQNSQDLGGSITIVSGGGTAYNTSSDYRLKEDWQPMEGALDRVDALKPINFAWKVNGERVDGFLAHELAEVVPEAVTGEKDATQIRSVEVSPAVYEDVIHPAQEAILDEEGNVIEEAKEEWVEKVLVSEAVLEDQEFPVYQGIDQSKIVPLLVAAIQELRAELNALKQA